MNETTDFAALRDQVLNVLQQRFPIHLEVAMLTAERDRLKLQVADLQEQLRRAKEEGDNE